MELPSQKTTHAARIRRTFIAGLFAFLPLAVTAFILWWVNDKTSVITSQITSHFKFFGRPIPHIPFLGVAITIAAVYGTGVITTSIVGRFLLKIVDAILMRLPGVRLLYLSWKQIALTPGGTEGTFSRTLLIPDESGTMKLLGFSSGKLVEADEPSYCVFVPSSPNPITGRLYFVRADRCQFIAMSPEEAFKVILSTGNYVPALIAARNDSLADNPAPKLAIPSGRRN